MKFVVTFNFDSIKDASREKDENQEIQEDLEEELTKFISEWIEYSEYINIEFDTEAKTATVLKLKR